MNDVVLFRILVTLLLVVYHSTCFFRGSWDVPNGYIGEDVKMYEAIANISYSFLLEGFTFISGYVYAYQVKIKGDYIFVDLIKNKFKRLMFPSLFWSVVYLLLFNEYYELNSLELITKIISGVHHFWFLPMLFFCFLFFFLAEKYINFYITFILSFFLVIIKSKYFIPFGIGYALQYLYYFVLGVFIYRESKWIKENLLNIKYLVIFSTLYVFLFVLYYCVNLTNVSIFSKIIHFFELRLFKSFALIAVFIGLNLYLKGKNKLSPQTYSFAKLSMGIYIFHQMILDFLYYETNLSESVNIYVFPIIGFIVSMFLSVLLTYFGSKLIFFKKLI